VLHAQLHHIETLRDHSHVRAYRLSDWRKFLRDAGLDLHREITDLYSESPRGMDFDDWVRRSKTPPSLVAELRRLFTTASPALRDLLTIQTEGASIWFRLPQVTFLAQR
jgi:hypothetical protein